MSLTNSMEMKGSEVVTCYIETFYFHSNIIVFYAKIPPIDILSKLCILIAFMLTILVLSSYIHTKRKKKNRKWLIG